MVSCTAKKGNSPVLFEISSDNSTLYILGSIHTSDDSIYPLPNYVMSRFKNSSKLVMEIKPKSDSSAVIQNKYYQGDDNISNHVSEKTYNLIKEYSEDIGIPLSILASKRPYRLISFIETDELKRGGFISQKGIEGNFHYEANKSNIEIDGFESYEEILAATNKVDSNELENMLVEVLETRDQSTEKMEEMLLKWREGDLSYFEKFVEEHFSKYPTFYESVIKNRNLKIVNKMETFLTKKQNIFVTIGLEHLVGDENVISLLKSKGYEVKIITE
ncbi:MAG: TraB/GumN family protein [Melioribacteraceae bacterium]|nr:TraB/GumN family protein [Melioribacteraceae bacterium]